jgi:hypothetical protein
MKSISILTLFIFILFPMKVLAHGEEVLQIVFIDAFVFFALLLFIGFAKWKMNGKMRLLLVLFFSEFILALTLGSLPYNDNKLMITILSAAIPIVVVISVYIRLRNKYQLRK